MYIPTSFSVSKTATRVIIQITMFVKTRAAELTIAAHHPRNNESIRTFFVEPGPFANMVVTSSYALPPSHICTLIHPICDCSFSGPLRPPGFIIRASQMMESADLYPVVWRYRLEMTVDVWNGFFIHPPPLPVAEDNIVWN